MASSFLICWTAALFLSLFAGNNADLIDGKPYLIVPLNRDLSNQLQRNNTLNRPIGFQVPSSQPSYPGPNFTYGNGSKNPGNYYGPPGNYNVQKYPAQLHNSYASGYGNGSGNNYNSKPAMRTIAMGQQMPGDEICSSSSVIRRPKWFRSPDLTKTIDFPDKLTKNSLQVKEITYMEAKDLSEDGSSGGTMRVTEGGIGSRRVRLIFASDPSKPISMGLTIRCIKAKA